MFSGWMSSRSVRVRTTRLSAVLPFSLLYPRSSSLRDELPLAATSLALQPSECEPVPPTSPGVQFGGGDLGISSNWHCRRDWAWHHTRSKALSSLQLMIDTCSCNCVSYVDLPLLPCAHPIGCRLPTCYDTSVRRNNERHGLRHERCTACRQCTTRCTT